MALFCDFLLLLLFSYCSLNVSPDCVWLCVMCMCLSMCVLFLSVPALLMDCHPGLSRKAASSVGLGINPGIMALMPSWVEAKLFKKYWLPESLSPLFLSPPLSIFRLYRCSLAEPVIVLYLFSLWFSLFSITLIQLDFFIFLLLFFLSFDFLPRFISACPQPAHIMTFGDRYIFKCLVIVCSICHALRFIFKIRVVNLEI